MRFKTVVAAIILGITLFGCGRDSEGEKSGMDQENILTENTEIAEDAEIATYVLTEEEERLLCEVYVDEDRIREGKLYGYQLEVLEEMRAAREYIEKKYPGAAFAFTAYTPITRANSIGRIAFHTVDDPDKYYEMSLQKTENDLMIKDNFYAELVREDYDRAVRNMIKDALGIDCLVYTDFYDLKGMEVTGETTTQELIDMKDGLSRKGCLFFRSDDVDQIQVEAELKHLFTSEGLYGSYTVFTGQELIDHEKTAEELYKGISTFGKEEVTVNYFNCFDIQ
ncbi:MAG: hypothetical protein IJ600_12970 [Lachnospiraceae bacterium]|nr:hypothetical protein [Lachnospiraceae bacterium]